MNQPPFSITSTILSQATDIAYLLGELDGLAMDLPKIQLRKENSIRTIQASLAIEGNTLSLEQVSAIVEGTPVIGPEQDIIEVNNALKVYGQFSSFILSSEKDFKRAHKLMMLRLIKEAGQYRSGNVGVFAGSQVAHVAPPAKRVPKLISELFDFLKNDSNTSLLLKACIFHYEVEFIHPFSDGNGRMGRLWQQVILSQYHRIFRYVPIETLIKQKQKEYYKVLSRCDKSGESTLFIEFSLSVIAQALKDYFNNVNHEPKTPYERLEYVRGKINASFTRKDYCDCLKSVSTASASRDLKYGVENKILTKSGDKRLTVYEFIRP